MTTDEELIHYFYSQSNLYANELSDSMLLIADRLDQRNKEIDELKDQCVTYLKERDTAINQRYETTLMFERDNTMIETLKQACMKKDEIIDSLRYKSDLEIKNLESLHICQKRIENQRKVIKKANTTIQQLREALKHIDSLLLGRDKLINIEIGNIQGLIRQALAQTRKDQG